MHNASATLSCCLSICGLFLQRFDNSLIILLLKVNGGGDLLGAWRDAVGCHDELVLDVIVAIDNSNDPSEKLGDGVVNAVKIDVKLLAVSSKDIWNIAVVEGVDQHAICVFFVVDVADRSVDLDADKLSEVALHEVVAFLKSHRSNSFPVML